MKFALLLKVATFGCTFLLASASRSSGSYAAPPKKIPVPLYLANQICYVRLGLLMVAASSAESEPMTFVKAYSASVAMDGIDGMAARRLNQCSQLGAVLDMVTDRLSNVFLLQSIRGCPQLPLRHHVLTTVDVLSHWLAMQASARKGVNHKDKTNHDAEAGGGGGLGLGLGGLARKAVGAYYRNKPLFMYCCISQELFYLLIYYVNNFEQAEGKYSKLPEVMLRLTKPGWFIKLVVSACKSIALLLFM